MQNEEQVARIPFLHQQRKITLVDEHLKYAQLAFLHDKQRNAVIQIQQEAERQRQQEVERQRQQEVERQIQRQRQEAEKQKHEEEKAERQRQQEAEKQRKQEAEKQQQKVEYEARLTRLVDQETRYANQRLQALYDQYESEKQKAIGRVNAAWDNLNTAFKHDCMQQLQNGATLDRINSVLSNQTLQSSAPTLAKLDRQEKDAKREFEQQLSNIRASVANAHTSRWNRVANAYITSVKQPAPELPDLLIQQSGLDTYKNINHGKSIAALLASDVNIEEILREFELNRQRIASNAVSKVVQYYNTVADLTRAELASTQALSVDFLFKLIKERQQNFRRDVVTRDQVLRLVDASDISVVEQEQKEQSARMSQEQCHECSVLCDQLTTQEIQKITHLHAGIVQKFWTQIDNSDIFSPQITEVVQYEQIRLNQISSKLSDIVQALNFHARLYTEMCRSLINSRMIDMRNAIRENTPPPKRGMTEDGEVDGKRRKIDPDIPIAPTVPMDIAGEQEDV